eukprot:56551_1
MASQNPPELHAYCAEALRHLALFKSTIPEQNYKKLVVILSNMESLLLFGRTFDMGDWIGLLGGEKSECQVEALFLYKYCKEKADICNYVCVAPVNGNDDTATDNKSNDHELDSNKITANKWRFVYENDKNGKCVNGDINDLISNINEGCEVRVMLNLGGQIKLWTAEVVIVKDGIVYAQNNTQISLCGFHANSSTFFQDNAYHYYVVVSSKGQNDMTRYNVSDGQSRGHTNQITAIKWFVKN